MHCDLRHTHAMAAMQSVNNCPVLKFCKSLFTRVSHQRKQSLFLITLHYQNRDHTDAELAGATVSLEPVQQKTALRLGHHHD